MRVLDHDAWGALLSVTDGQLLIPTIHLDNQWFRLIIHLLPVIIYLRSEPLIAEFNHDQGFEPRIPESSDFVLNKNVFYTSTFGCGT